MSRTFSSLRVRNYRLFAAGQLVSLTGTWMQRVGQDWLVLRLSHNSGTAIGITTGLQFLPILLFGLQGGVIADRFSKRKLILATQVTMGLLALGLGLLDLFGAVSLYDVYVFAFLLGMATAVDNPTRQAFVSELVGSAELPNAVGLNSATFNAARIFGPAVAGLMIDGVGTAWVFLANAASFVAVITGLLMMRPAELISAPRLVRQSGNLREGLSYVRHNKELLVPIALVGVVGTFGINFQITLALVDKVVFHKGAASFGLLSSMLAGGALLGALLAARRTHPTTRLVVLGAIAFGLLEVGAGLMPSFTMLAIALVPLGLANLTFSDSGELGRAARLCTRDARPCDGHLHAGVRGRHAARGALGGLDIPGVRRPLGDHRWRGREHPGRLGRPGRHLEEGSCTRRIPVGVCERPDASAGRQLAWR